MRNPIDVFSPEVCAAMARRGLLSGSEVYSLRARGALGDDDVQPTEVTPQGAAFIAQAKARLAKMQADAEAIGPPGIFDFGSTYGEKWTGVLDALEQLLQDGERELANDPAAMTVFLDGTKEINKAIFKIRSQSPTKELYAAVIGAFSGNPFAVLRFVERTASSAVDLGTDVKKEAGASCSFLGVILGSRSVADYWKTCIPTSVKVGGGVVAFVIAALAVRKVYRVIS